MSWYCGDGVHEHSCPPSENEIFLDLVFNKIQVYMSENVDSPYLDFVNNKV